MLNGWQFNPCNISHFNKLCSFIIRSISISSHEIGCMNCTMKCIVNNNKIPKYVYIRKQTTNNYCYYCNVKIPNQKNKLWWFQCKVLHHPLWCPNETRKSHFIWALKWKHFHRKKLYIRQLYKQNNKQNWAYKAFYSINHHHQINWN